MGTSRIKRRPSPTLRLKNLVLWKAVLLTALCAITVFGLWWWGLIHSVETQGRARAGDALGRMNQAIARELQRAEDTGIAFGSWWSREHGRLEDPERLQNVIPFLDRQAIVSNLVLSRADGDSACVVRKDGQWNLVLFKAGRNPRRYRIEGGRWVLGPGDEREVYEARDRYWYRFGAAQAAPAWTPQAYRYFSSAVGGFTYTVPVRSPDGRLEGVIGVDVSLEELTQLIWEQHPTPGSIMLVTDPASRLLVPPRLKELGDPAARFAQHLRTLAQDPLGHFTLGAQARPLAGETGLLDPARSYVAATESFAPEGRPRMALHVALPKDELFPGHRGWARFTFLLALGAVLGVAWSLLDLHRRVVQPMRRLAEEGTATPLGAPELPDFNSDIWELQRVGERLRLASRGAQERDRLLDQVEHSQRVSAIGMMAPGIMHDANNQLTMVLGQIGLCQTILEEHSSLQRHLQAAHSATLKCAEVLRALVDFSRPAPSQREPLSLNDTVRGAASLLRRAVGPSIRIEEELAPDLPTLFGEPVKLQQVLLNLGLNARDAMPDGGPLVLRTYRTGDKACLEVKDAGCGMTEEVRLRVFEPFFSTKSPDKGTGLGLAMVANIVANHGGQIRVESEVGVGTLIRIEFPPSLRRES